MAGIQEYLDLIKNAIYGKDVRQAIHDGILQCYLDARGEYKVNRPLNSDRIPTDGTNGQLLRTKGDGSTEWVDVGLPTDEQTETAITAWLNAHPEATTTVQDDSLTTVKYKNKSVTADKVADSFKRDSLFGKCIFPVYIGDYLSASTKVPSAVLKMGDFFYTFDAPSDGSAQSAHSNVGTIRKFDIVNNVEVVSDVITADIAHANSVAYDTVNERIYVAPVWDYSTPSRSNTDYLYVFDTSLNSLGTIQLPTQAMGVSYDHVNNKLYYYDYNQDVYILDGGEWVLYTHVDFTGVVESLRGNRSYNQDFAVYDNKFYISSPYGNIVWGYLKEETSFIVGSYVCGFRDSTNRFSLGELEGMEFDADGHLYAIDYIDISGDYRNAFVVELPINTSVQYSTNLTGNVFSARDASVTLSEETQKCFALQTYWIRAISQLKILTYANGISQVTIPANNTVVENGEVVINKDLMITLGGTYWVRVLAVFGGNVVFNIPDTSGKELLVCTDGSNAIRVDRAGRVTFGSRTGLHVSTPNASNFGINVGYTTPITVMSKIPISKEGYDIYIGGSVVTQTGLYRGSTFVG